MATYLHTLLAVNCQGGSCRSGHQTLQQLLFILEQSSHILSRCSQLGPTPWQGSQQKEFTTDLKRQEESKSTRTPKIHVQV